MDVLSAGRGPVRTRVAAWRDRGKPPLHLLHPSKSGGTAVKHALADARLSAFRLSMHPHRVTLADIPAGEQVCFVVREPASRFVSGFNSRLRRGGVVHAKEWTEQERATFERFATADDLARALYATDPGIAADAAAAVESILHLRMRQVDWVVDLDTLHRRADDVLFVGRQWALDEDFSRLARVIGAPDGTRLPTGTAAHRAPPGSGTPLSDEGRAAVLTWYAQDVRLLEELQALGKLAGYPPDGAGG